MTFSGEGNEEIEANFFYFFFLASFLRPPNRPTTFLELVQVILFICFFFSTRASSNVDFPAYSDGGDVEHIDDIAPSASAADPDGGANVMMMTGGDRFEEDNYCRRNNSFVWCLPKDYNQEKHPFTCERGK